MSTGIEGKFVEEFPRSGEKFPKSIRFPRQPGFIKKLPFLGIIEKYEDKRSIFKIKNPRYYGILFAPIILSFIKGGENMRKELLERWLNGNQRNLSHVFISHRYLRNHFVNPKTIAYTYFYKNHIRNSLRPNVRKHVIVRDISSSDKRDEKKNDGNEDANPASSFSVFLLIFLKNLFEKRVEMHMIGTRLHEKILL